MFRIYDGRFEFYQWDLDRKILVADPAITEVHFCNKTDSCSLVTEVYELEGKRVADVPNVLLQENWDIRVYGYCGDCYTRASARFKVVGRTRPADYVYTETEVKRWEAMEQRCEEVLEMAETLTKGAVSGESFMDYEALITNLNTAPKNRYYNPQHLLIRTLEVPDLWIYEVKEESVTYEYVDDQTFVEEVMNGLVQVGYFVLSPLETGKVDLTDYVKNTDYASKENYGLVRFGSDGFDAPLGIFKNSVYPNFGANANNGGGLTIAKARYADIDARSPSNYSDGGANGANHCKPIVPANLDYAVISVLTNYKGEALTEEQKAAARKLLGIE